MPIATNYKETKVMTASPMELILMLYDACIASLKKAEEAFKIETPDKFQEINNNLLHAQNVIVELTVSLDFEKGGQIAKNLHNLYDFCSNQLTKANIKKEVAPIRNVRETMTELRETWQKVADQEKASEESPVTQTSGSGILVSG